VALLLNTGYFVVLTNLLGTQTAEVGIVTLFNILIALTATVSNLALPLGGAGSTGTPPAVSRFVSEYTAKGERGAARKILTYSVATAGALSLVLSFILFSNPRAYGIHDVAGGTAFYFAGIDAVVYSIAQLGAYSLIGTGRAVAAAYALIASNVLRYFAASILLFYLGLFGIFLGFALGDFVLVIIALPLSFAETSHKTSSSVDRKLILTYMFSVLVSSLIGFGIGQFDKLLALFQGGTTQLAIYNVGIAAAAVASFAPSAITNVLVPTLSSIPLTEVVRRRKLMEVYTRYVAFVSAPMGFLTAATSPFLLRVFGDQYVVGSPLVAIVALAVAFSAEGAVYSSFILAGRKTHLFLAGNLLGLFTLVVLAVPLLPRLGLTGVAVGRAGMVLVAATTFAYTVRKAGNFVLDGRAYVKAILGSVVSGGTVYLLLFFMSSQLSLTRLGSVISSFLALVPGVGIYLLFLKTSKAFSREDVEFLRAVLPKGLSWIAELAKKLL
jgi:O-antigen/teichoic acid export membrane protein